MKIVSVTTFFPDSHSLNLPELHCFFISKTFVILTRQSWIVFCIIWKYSYNMCPRIPKQTIILKLGNLQCRSFNSFVNFLQPLLYLESQRIFLAVHIKKISNLILLFYTHESSDFYFLPGAPPAPKRPRTGTPDHAAYMKGKHMLKPQCECNSTPECIEDTLGADERLQRSEGIQVSISRGNQAEWTPSWSLPSKTHREILFDTKRRG